MWRRVREYLRELEQENGAGETTHQQDRVSTTEPDATYASKGTMIATLGYYDNYLVDNQSCVIVDVQATAQSFPRSLQKRNDGRKNSQAASLKT